MVRVFNKINMPGKKFLPKIEEKSSFFRVSKINDDKTCV